MERALDSMTAESGTDQNIIGNLAENFKLSTDNTIQIVKLEHCLALQTLPIVSAIVPLYHKVG